MGFVSETHRLIASGAMGFALRNPSYE